MLSKSGPKLGERKISHRLVLVNTFIDHDQERYCNHTRHSGIAAWAPSVIVHYGDLEISKPVSHIFTITFFYSIGNFRSASHLGGTSYQ